MQTPLKTVSVGYSNASARDRWSKLASANEIELNGVTGSMRDYGHISRKQEFNRPGFWSRLARPFRAAKTGDRVLAPAVNGIAYERFRRVLERQNCRIDDVRFSDDRDLAFIEFTFQEDNGVCSVALTDVQLNNTYVRSCLSAAFPLTVSAQRLNELNLHGKFLKFYMAANRLVAEYSVLMIDLNDDALAANIDMFHGAVRFIIGNDFRYDGMSS